MPRRSDEIITVYTECSFFIPMRRDAHLSDGDLHAVYAWSWLDQELYQRFTARTLAPGMYSGVYQDPDTGRPVTDSSRRYVVAIAEDRHDELRELLRDACEWFCQKCIYLSIAGRVEFIGPRLQEP